MPYCTMVYYSAAWNDIVAIQLLRRMWFLNYVFVAVISLLSLQELDPLPDLIKQESISESELEECKRVI